ncbi:MAG: ribosome small subunit-dependent GTPase A [Cyanobacteriota bacterium]|nr:ribosome small subunit-dependent GTPase A [Cyanobacteriota bacterium]
MAESLPCGRVVAIQANFCWVEPELPAAAGVTRLLCTQRTRLGKSGLRICTGDRVRLAGIDWTAGRAAVAALIPRRSLLVRPAVANLSRVVVVVALAEPELDPLQLTRFLISAEATGQAVELVFSKADLADRAAASGWLREARSWGYEPLAVSTTSGVGLEELRSRLSRPGLAVLSGPSGVGKSSLLNALRPELGLRVRPVSGRLQRGRHTTRHVELFALGPGAHVADSPGFNRPDLPADPTALAMLFPELRGRLAAAGCRFRNCLHQGDPGCAIEAGWNRESLYLQCLSELLAESGKQQRSSGRVEGLRQRGSRQEPCLDPRLRQGSRRRQRQLGCQEDQAEGVIRPDPEDSDRP